LCEWRDAPEITAAVTALIRDDPRVGAGVVIGSNVFNLAVLLGLSALVAGQIALHRRVIELAGAVALWMCAATLAVLTGVLSPPPWASSLIAAGAVVVVVGASVAMERVATELGVRHAVPGIVVGALVLAVVTSLPNAVAAVPR
jgi:Ca2+/Na+ antiporter